MGPRPESATGMSPAAGKPENSADTDDTSASASEHDTSRAIVGMENAGRHMTADGGMQPGTDAGAASEGGSPARVLCRARMRLAGRDDGTSAIGTIYETWAATSHAYVATDALGNIVIAGSFVGKIDFGADTVSDMGSDWAMFVAKFDAQCQPLWSHAYGGPGSRVEGGPIGIGPDNEIVVGGSLFQTADFGTGQVESKPGKVNGFVLKLRSDGTARFFKLYQTDDNSVVYSVAIDGAGKVLVSGSPWTDPAFGDMQSPGLGGTLAKYTADGDPLWIHFLPAHTERVHLQAASDGSITISGDGSLDWGDGTPPLQPSTDVYFTWLSQFTPDGTRSWSIPTTEGSVGWGVFQALDPSGVTTLSYGAGMDGSTVLRAVDAIDADGKVVSHATWISTSDLQGYDFATDTHGDAIEVGITANAQTDDDVYIAKHDREGHLIWTTQEVTDRVDRALGVTADSDENTIALWYSDDMSHQTSDELVLVKLAP